MIFPMIVFSLICAFLIWLGLRKPKSSMTYRVTLRNGYTQEAPAFESYENVSKFTIMASGVLRFTRDDGAEIFTSQQWFISPEKPEVKP